MAQSIKLKNDKYWDVSSIAKGNMNLNTYFSEMFKMQEFSTDKFSVTAETPKRGSLPITIPTGYKLFFIRLSYYNYCDANFVQFSFNNYNNTIYWYITPNYSANDENLIFKVIYIKNELIQALKESDKNEDNR